MLYLALLLAFSVSVCRYRQELLWLHYVLTAVVIVGTIEVVTWFSMFVDLNTTGAPICCPLHAFAGFAIVLNVVKRTVSRCVLVAVCLGFGVVRPRLPMRQTIAIVTLGAMYFVFATVSDIRINSAVVEAHDDPWATPVLIADIIFVLWIFHGLTRVQEDLETLRQTLKLGMYVRLKKALMLFTILWILFAIFSEVVAHGIIYLSWKHTWMLHSFWHFSYFAVLAVMCWIWRPSPQSQQYAYSFQIPSSAEEAEAYEMDIETDTSVVVEMTKIKKSDDSEERMNSSNGSSTKGDVSSSGERQTDIYDDDDDELDTKIGTSRNPFGDYEEDDDGDAEDDDVTV